MNKEEREVKKNQWQTKINADLRDICRRLDTPLREVWGGKKDRVSSRRRWAVAKELRAMHYSYPQIGWAMRRHHTGVMHMVDDKWRARRQEAMRCRPRESC